MKNNMKLVGFIFLAGICAAVLFKGAEWDLRRQEDQARFNLNIMREEVAKANQENKPLDILAEAPSLWVAMLAELPHPSGSSVALRTNREPQDTGYWAYDNATQRVYIDCTHTDSRGAVWTTY